MSSHTRPTAGNQATMPLHDRTVRYWFIEATGAWIATCWHRDGWQCSAVGRSSAQAVKNAWKQVDFMEGHKQRWGC